MKCLKMNEMKNLFFKKWTSLIHISIIGLSLYFICQFSSIQKKISPLRYWKGKVIELEVNIQAAREKKILLQKKLEKKRAFQPRAFLVKALPLNKDEMKQLEIAEKKRERRIQDIEKKLDQLTISQKRNKEMLHSAKKEYELLLKKQKPIASYDAW